MIKIAVIGSHQFGEYVQGIQADRLFSHIQLSFIFDHFSAKEAWRFEKIAEEIETTQPHALVMGPYDYERLSPRVNIPCYVVHPTMQDFLMLHPYIEDYEKVAVILSPREHIDIPTLERCLNVKYHQYYYHKDTELPDIIQTVKQRGFDSIISNSTALEIAKHKGLFGYYYFSRKTIEDGIQNAVQIVLNLEREQNHVNEVRSILDNATCGAIYVTESPPTVSFINRTAREILHRKDSDFIQKPLAHNFPTHICDQILRCYEPINNVQFSLCGVDIIANIVPVEAAENERSICILFEKTDYILKRESIIRQRLRRQKFDTRYSFHDIKGKSAALRKAVEQAKRFAAADATIFICAETGAGKEVFAQSIHDQSKRREYPFIAINCASIPDSLIESELFGYTPGSFTGASSKGKQGLIELANHGTIFLDDVDGLSYSFQAKLLRVMQEQEIVRIGGESPIPVDVRFIVATNRDLRKMVREGQFRNDLYFRINVLPLNIPPLRERKEDIPELYEYYLSMFDYELYQKIKDRFQDIFEPALSYSYPGNVRELINVTERFKSLVDTRLADDDVYLTKLVLECMDKAHLLDISVAECVEFQICGDYEQDIQKAEQIVLQKYLQNSDSNMTQLAKKLNMSRTTLYNKLKQQRLVDLSSKEI